MESKVTYYYIVTSFNKIFFTYTRNTLDLTNLKKFIVKKKKLIHLIDTINKVQHHSSDEPIQIFLQTLNPMHFFPVTNFNYFIFIFRWYLTLQSNHTFKNN